jgi:putative membrane protein
MDIAIVLFTVLPLLLGFAIRFAKRRRYLAHRNLQTATLLLILILIVLFELNIRLSGGTSTFLAKSSVNPHFLRVFLRFHIVVATITAIVWTTLVVRSWRRFRRELPGSFSRAHRRWGWITFGGVFVLSSTGCALYVMLFVI